RSRLFGSVKKEGQDEPGGERPRKICDRRKPALRGRPQGQDARAQIPQAGDQRGQVRQDCRTLMRHWAIEGETQAPRRSQPKPARGNSKRQEENQEQKHTTPERKESP